MPGQCFSSPSFKRAKRSGSELGVSSGLRTWAWTMLAPASKASCVLSICSGTVIGTAGLSALRGSDPVIATQMMQGLVVSAWFAIMLGRSARAAAGRRPQRNSAESFYRLCGVESGCSSLASARRHGQEPRPKPPGCQPVDRLVARAVRFTMLSQIGQAPPHLGCKSMGVQHARRLAGRVFRDALT